MFLDDYESEEEVAEALDAGDAELESQIGRMVERKVQGAWQTSEWELGMEPEEFVAMVDSYTKDNLSGLIDDMPDSAGEALEHVPEERINEELRYHIQSAAEHIANFSQGKRGGRETDLMEFASGRGPGPDLRRTAYELTVDLDSDGLEHVPHDWLLKFLEGAVPGAEWQETSDGRWQSGWLEGYDYWRLEIAPYRSVEWAVDLRDSYYSELVDADPDKAIATFMAILKSDYKEIHKAVKKAKLPKEVLADYAVTFFADPEEGVEAISEATGLWDYEGTRGELILEVDRDTLAQLGIVSGRWWDGAPWRLLNLPVEELAYEGTLMRHCVGRRSMGYREAVARGETYIWSLRSRFNKPILTFEVARYEWEAAADAGGMAPMYRARAIEQLKGKLNRLAGADPQETAVLFWIFDRLGVDPAWVSDFRGTPTPNPRPGGFDARWTPYAHRRLLRWS